MPPQSQTPAPAADSPAVETSRPASPSQNAENNSPIAGDEAADETPPPYFYEYVTNDVAEAWETSGRNAVLETARDADDMVLSTIMQEVIRAGLDRKLNCADAGSSIRDMIAQPSTSGVDVQEEFLHSLCLLQQADTKNRNLLPMIVATDIDPHILRLQLSVPLLEALSLVRKPAFSQTRNRKETILLYRQENFNLLREESEGYAKLITEYFNTANEATRDPTTSASEAFERVTALVGAFDLDVGRVLDITLDISANLLVRAYSFFVKFYRCSSWWPDSASVDTLRSYDDGFRACPPWALRGTDGHSPDHPGAEPMNQERDIGFWERVQETGLEAFFNIGARKIIDLEAALPLLSTKVVREYKKDVESNEARRKRIEEDRNYMRLTGFLPPPGNPDAAQLLGFKLGYYVSEARDAQDVLPENLIYLAALLIKIGFISLRDLYPHLHPADDKMPEERKRLEKEKAEKEIKERPGVGANALAMAAALTDDSLPLPATRNLRDKAKSGGSTPKPDQKAEDPQLELPTPANQKIMILKALLLIGALPEALYILGRFPWLTEVDHTLPPYLHRLANQMLSKIAAMVNPYSSADSQASRDELDLTAPQATGPLSFKPREIKAPVRWLGLDQVNEKDGQTHRHYYAEWDDNIPLCQNVDDVFLLCNTFLGYLGVKIGQDAKLYHTLVRIAKYNLSQDFSESNQSRWLDLMRRLLIPALSLSKHNAGLTQEIYELLKFFPTTVRYNIYAEWYFGKTSRLPDMRVAFDHNRAEVKDVLRRVTNETGKKQARALAKVSFASPGIVMLNMINQLESYSNMIPSLVECTRYFSLLAYDVLTWCLINSLSGQGRDRIQADGMLTSPWLQALSSFVAALFHRYTVLNPSPVLQYLACELRAGNSTDLEMFEQLLAEMAGIRSDIEFNDAQVLAMSGGKYLQAQTVMQLADKRHERKSQAQRLLKALSDPGLIGQTLIAIAQERQNYPHHESSRNMPLKVLGNNLDKVQQVFAQYLDVLKTNLNPAEFEAAVPDVVALVGDFGLEPGIAFTICRFCISQRVNEYDAAKKQESDDKKRTQSKEQAESKGLVLVNGDANASDADQAVIGDAPNPSDITDSIGDSEAPTPATVAPPARQQRWHPVLQPIIDHLPLVSPELAERVSIPFFVSFWTRSLEDILVSTMSYENENNKLRTQLKDVNNDRSDVSASGIKERDRKKKSLSDIQDKLREELKGRIAAYQKTRNRISREEKDHWFNRSIEREVSQTRHIALLQECFLPRAMLSSLDAHYCFLMFKILHDNGTPGFNTVHLLGELFKTQQLASIIFQCTAMEAQHFGRFLHELLKLLHHWHADKATFDKEALGEKQKLPGFWKTTDTNGEPTVIWQFEQYRNLLFSWHKALNGALQICFESGEYMSIRNGITVLRAIAPVFPAINFMGTNMVTHVTRLSNEETRQDLNLAAKSLLGPLKAREKHWVLPQLFRINEPSKDQVKASGRAALDQSETPHPKVETPKLSATAPEFKPGSEHINGTTRKESIAVAEDGEIEDEKPATVKSERDVQGGPESKSAIGTSRTIGPAISSDIVSRGSTPKPNALDTQDAAKVASRSNTPAPIPVKPPPPAFRATESRTDGPRSSSTHANGVRPSHSVPTKFPDKPMPTPSYPERSSSRYGNRPDEQYGRLNRPSDMRPASREQSPGRSRPRTPDGDPRYGRSAADRQPRDDRVLSQPYPDDRQTRDVPYGGSRRDQPSQASSRPAMQDPRGRADGPMGPPSRQPPHGQSEVADSTRSRNVQNSVPDLTASPGDSKYSENPARLALINQDTRPARSKDSAPSGTDSRRDQQEQESRAAPAVRHPDTRDAPQEPLRHTQDRPSQPADWTPTGPRRGGGRPSQEYSTATSQESSYGRLNGSQEASPNSQPPNGPSGRSTRSHAAQPPQFNMRPSEPLQSSRPSSRAPEPPAAQREPSSRPPIDHRTSNHQTERLPQSNSSPSTPATESGPPVHPSRLGNVSMQPPPIQTNVPQLATRTPSSPASGAQLGPRGSTRPPAGPSPSSNVPPSGPASAIERQRQPDSRRQLGSINATLQGGGSANGANGQSVSFRGAAQGRQPSGPGPSSGPNVPTAPVVASQIDPLNRRNESYGFDRQSGPPYRSENQADLFQAKQPPFDGGRGSNRPRHTEDDRSDRQRSSRHSSRERRPAEQQQQQPPRGPHDGTQGSGYGDVRGSGPRDDRIAPRNDRERDPREGMQSRDTRSHQNDDYPPRRPQPTGPNNSFSGARNDERERPQTRGAPSQRMPSDQGGRAMGRPEDYQSHAQGPRGYDDRHDGGIPPPGNRKRRHEEAPYDQSKRTRSGR